MPALKLHKADKQQAIIKAEYGKSSSVLKHLKFAFYGLIFSLIILAVFAVIITYSPLGEKYISLIATLASVSGVLFSSFKIARYYKSRGILNGLISSLVYFLIIALMGALLFESDVNYGVLFKNLIYYMPVGIIGGILGVNIKSN